MNVGCLREINETIQTIARLSFLHLSPLVASEGGGSVTVDPLFIVAPIVCGTLCLVLVFVI